MNKFGLLASSALRSAAAVGFTFAMAAPAFAQTGTGTAATTTQDASKAHDPSTPTPSEAPQLPQASEATPTGEQIVVTGSRIRRPNLDSTNPITSVGPQELTERGNVSLGDALNELPSLRSTFSQANSTGFIGTAGLNELDLRGQGTTRTLVLINGRRAVSAVPGSYIVDVNTIPSDLLERVDIVTGGNSAIYGSDAIAGVVNFVLKRNYDGIRLHAQAGVSKYGDRGTQTVSGIIGRNFLDERVNVTLAVEYAKTRPLFFKDRPYLGSDNSSGNGGVPGFITSEITTAPNRNFDGIPNTRFVSGGPGITFGNISLGGYVSTSCPAATPTNAARVALLCTGATTPTGGRIAYNFAFLPDGTLARDDPSRGLVDNRAIGGGVLGGLSATGVEDSMLEPGLERINTNLLVHANLSEAFKPFLEASYTRVIATQQSTQPTFISGTINNVFSVNNPFLSQQAKDTLAVITNGASTFSLLRFNNDIGTRSERHLRETYRAVGGFEGNISQKGNLHYEVALNYGRTTTYYKAGGNVDIAKFNNALNAVRNASGQIVCGINADASTTNDDPACVPFNPFGNGSPSQAAKNYVIYPSERNQWAEEIDATAFLAGDSSGFFSLPGGPVGFAIGAEYRREDAYSDYDDYTQSGATFLNAAATFAPPAVNVKEAFGELRLPLLKDVPFFKELSIEAAARVSDYGGKTGAVWAYNVGGIWAPIHDIRFRASYAKSVRAPNLSNLYGTPAVTFANGFTDPCDQPGGTNAGNNITAGPNRAKNCAAAGIPTTITYVDASGATVTKPWTNVAGSGIQGVNQGNPGLLPEVGRSLTFGAVLQPRFLPGFSFSIDYYRIKITNLIAGLSGQGIANQCYDDPGGINNPYCASIFRRSAPGTVADLTFTGQSSRRLDNIAGGQATFPVIGNGFLNQPFNYAAQKTSGIDVDASYRTKIFNNIGLNLRALVSWVENREQFTSIAVPTQSTRILSTLGDPEWQAAFSANVDFGMFDLTYNLRYVGRQIVSALSYETFFPWQGRTATNPEARPFAYYSPAYYHNIRANFNVNKQFAFYLGVDNLTNKLPPYDLVGNETAGGAIYPNIGRFFYSGVTVKF
jgi:outer membrane receptor protein involved in Fe transport